MDTIMLEFVVNAKVTLNTPENDRLHGKEGIIYEVTEYGAIVRTNVGSGFFRALFSEMVLEGTETTNGVHVKKEYTGNCCVDCGSTNLLRTGSCETCQDCGRSSGCV